MKLILLSGVTILLAPALAFALTLMPSVVPHTVGMFATDGMNVYFVNSQMATTTTYSWVLYQTAIKEAHAASFVVDGIWQEFTTITVKAHDAHHSYVATQVRFPCGGNTIGCVIGTFLTVR